MNFGVGTQVFVTNSCVTVKSATLTVGDPVWSQVRVREEVLAYRWCPSLCGWLRCVPKNTTSGSVSWTGLSTFSVSPEYRAGLYFLSVKPFQ